MIPAAAFVGAVVLAVHLGPAECTAAERKPSMQTENTAADFAVPGEWIHSRVTLAEIEGPGAAPDLIKPADSPAWRAFKAKLRTHDELWYFTSPPGSFGKGAGRMGYVILRDGNQVASFTALIN